MKVFHERLSICGCAFFPFFVGGGGTRAGDLIVLVPDHAYLLTLCLVGSKK